MVDTAYVQQNAYAALGENQQARLRANRRGEIVVPDFRIQLVQDGRVFQISNPAVETAIAAGHATAFSETANVAFIVDFPSGTTGIPLEVSLRQGGTAAGGATITALITQDRIVRYSSGGTALTPINLRDDAPNSTAAVAYYGATAAAVNTDILLYGALVAMDVTPAIDTWTPGINWEPSVPPVLVGPASLVIYTFSGTTPTPSWFFRIVWAEIPSVSVV